MEPRNKKAETLASKVDRDNAIAELVADAVWHPEISAAAIAALETLENDGREYAGVIFQDTESGHYAYSTPIRGSNDQFSLRARVAPGLKLAGIYHTHPQGSESHLFSPNDVETAKKLGLLSFIRIIDSGEIRRFDPAKSKTRPMSRGVRGAPRAYVSEGELVPLPLP